MITRIKWVKNEIQTAITARKNCDAQRAEDGCRWGWGKQCRPPFVPAAIGPLQNEILQLAGTTTITGLTFTMFTSVIQPEGYALDRAQSCETQEESIKAFGSNSWGYSVIPRQIIWHNWRGYNPFLLFDRTNRTLEPLQGEISKKEGCVFVFTLRDHYGPVSTARNEKDPQGTVTGNFRWSVVRRSWYKNTGEGVELTVNV